jgi:hypothetical protein
VELSSDSIILIGEVLHAEAGGGLDKIRPLLHVSGRKFRGVGKEFLLKRKR